MLGGNRNESTTRSGCIYTKGISDYYNVDILDAHGIRHQRHVPSDMSERVYTLLSRTAHTHKVPVLSTERIFVLNGHDPIRVEPKSSESHH